MTPPPDFLYKYQPLSAYSLAAVVNNTVWLAQPRTFNDPFDCAITLDQNRFSESVQHAIGVATERGLIKHPSPQNSSVSGQKIGKPSTNTEKICGVCFRVWVFAPLVPYPTTC